jgi:hypothetical protein
VAEGTAGALLLVAAWEEVMLRAEAFRSKARRGLHRCRLLVPLSPLAAQPPTHWWWCAAMFGSLSLGRMPLDACVQHAKQRCDAIIDVVWVWCRSLGQGNIIRHNTGVFVLY